VPRALIEARPLRSSTSRWAAGGLSLGAVLVALALAAASADAAIEIYDTNPEARQVGKIKDGRCRVRGRGENRHFRASATSTNDRYRLEVTILDWRGYRREYSLRYGTNQPGVFYLDGPRGPFSNIFADYAPGVSAGGIAFARRGSRMSVGLLPAPNRSGRSGVVLAGLMRC
jgi:hypothetical protein